MRNRTEQVTNKMDESGSDEDFVDSGSEYEPDEDAPVSFSLKTTPGFVLAFNANTRFKCRILLILLTENI